jgi:AhpD family alkylhydroperoxidase
MRLPRRSSFGQNSEQLPGKAREVTTLVVSATFRCLYELYAHVVLAKLHGISEAKVATTCAEQRSLSILSESRPT